MTLIKLRMSIIGLALGYFSSACTAPTIHTDSSVHGLSADPNGGNVALLFETNFEYAIPDLNGLQSVLTDPTASYGFTATVKENTSQQELLSAITAGASKVGQNGTLFLYMAGHGSPNGYLETNDGQFVNFSSVQKAIAKGRTAPFRRLVLFVFSCYSGNWLEEAKQGSGLPGAAVNGSSTLTLTDMSSQMLNQISVGLAGANANGDSNTKLYNELLIATSSDAYTESWGGNGTYFANAIRSSYSRNKTNNSYTIDQFKNDVVQNGAANGGVPQFKAMPTSLFNETLKNNGTQTIPNPPPPTQPVSSALYVALQDPSGADTSGFIVASDSNITSTKICWDTFDHCQSGKAPALPLNNSSLKINGRNVYETSTTHAISDGITATILGFDTKNGMVAHQQIRIRPAVPISI